MPPEKHAACQQDLNTLLAPSAVFHIDDVVLGEGRGKRVAEPNARSHDREIAQRNSFGEGSVGRGRTDLSCDPDRVSKNHHDAGGTALPLAARRRLRMVNGMRFLRILILCLVVVSLLFLPSAQAQAQRSGTPFNAPKTSRATRRTLPSVRQRPQGFPRMNRGWLSRSFPSFRSVGPRSGLVTRRVPRWRATPRPRPPQGPTYHTRR